MFFLKHIITYSLLLVFFVLLQLTGCKGDNVTHVTPATNLSVSDVSQNKWNLLAQKKIFFGHQSVGNNIMAGIMEVINEYPEINFKISNFRTWEGPVVTETMQPSDFDAPVFAHEANLGKNNYPLKKIQDFSQILKGSIGNKIDIAFMKFCFVDIDSNTDVLQVFDEYSKNLEELKSIYPETIFVHFTVPLLKKDESGLLIYMKKFIKSLLKKKTDNFWDNQNNVKRNNYNKILLERYDGKEPVFDLAKFESTYPNGDRETFSFDGQSYYSLVPEYTADGGHLNQNGRKFIAEQLLIFLANM